MRALGYAALTVLGCLAAAWAGRAAVLAIPAS